MRRCRAQALSRATHKRGKRNRSSPVDAGRCQSHYSLTLSRTSSVDTRRHILCDSLARLSGLVVALCVSIARSSVPRCRIDGTSLLLDAQSTADVRLSTSVFFFFFWTRRLFCSSSSLRPVFFRLLTSKSFAFNCMSWELFVGPLKVVVGPRRTQFSDRPALLPHTSPLRANRSRK